MIGAKNFYFIAFAIIISVVPYIASPSIARGATKVENHRENQVCVKLLSLSLLNRAQNQSGAQDVQEWFKRGVEFPPLEIPRNLSPADYWKFHNKTYKTYLLEVYGIEAEDRYPNFIRSTLSDIRTDLIHGKLGFKTLAEWNKYFKNQGLTIPLSSMQKVLNEIKLIKNYDTMFTRKLSTFEISQNDPEQLSAQIALVSGYLGGAFGNVENAKPYQLSVDRISSSVNFSPYTSILSPFTQRAAPSELTPQMRDGIEGIVRLWNAPDIVVKLLELLRNKIDAKLQAQPQLSRSEALDRVRKDYEYRNGFGSVVTSSALLEDSDWLELLNQGHPHQDTRTGHAFYYPNEGEGMGGQKVHRNQWLIIMLAREACPQLFASFTGPIVQLYKSMGDGKWLYTWGFGSSEYVSYIQNGKILWGLLFDNSTRTKEGINVPTLANAANPSYFVEFFSEYLGVGVND